MSILSIEAKRFLYQETKEVIKTWVAPLLGLAVTALLLAACTPQEAQGIVTTRITKPLSGDVVKYMDTVEGTVQNLPRNWRVWIAVTDEHDRVLHPQEGPAISLGTDGRGWRRDRVRFGNNEIPTPNEDTVHTLSVLIANPNGNGELERYMLVCHTQNFCPGYNPSGLPDGVTLQPDTTTVHRKRLSAP